jgi:non-ribosomal peptide synthetase component F
LIDQLFNSSEKRLARLLLLLANFGKEGSPQPIDTNFDQGTLAEMFGTTRSRVSSFMQIPQTGLHQLQRQDRSPSLAIERGLAREAADRAERDANLSG